MLEHVTIVLECGHHRYVTLDVTGKNGFPVGRAKQIASAFLEPCRVCKALDDAREQDDRAESLEVFRVLDRRARDMEK